MIMMNPARFRWGLLALSSEQGRRRKGSIAKTRRIRRRVGPRRNLSHLRLGPQRIADHIVTLRPPCFADFATWRRIRLLNRAHIEPFWASSDLNWDQRHTEKRWVRECLIQRRNGRTGTGLSLVIEVDGRFAGQCSVGDIDNEAATGELGVWVDAKLARSGVGGLATAMILDFGFAELGLDRITAPICVENEAAAASASRGLVHEAVMTEYFDAGGRRKDHSLWAAVREDSPSEGFVEHWLRSVRPGSEPAPTRTAQKPAPPPRWGTMPRTWTALAAVGRFYLGPLRSMRLARSSGKPLQLRSADAPGLLLRQPTSSDYGTLAASGRDIQRAHEPTVLSARSRRRLWWLRKYVRLGPAPGELSRLPLVAEVDGILVSECGLRQVDMCKRSAELDLWATYVHRDLDIAERAVRVLIEHAMGEIGLHRITAVCDTGDRVAATVLANAGLTREGTMHLHVDARKRRGDHDLWALTASADSRTSRTSVS